MSGPGKGRYTDYVSFFTPGSSLKHSRLHKIFNTNPMISPNDSKGLLYGSTNKERQVDNTNAAKTTTEVYVNSVLNNSEAKDFSKSVFLNNRKTLVYYTGDTLSPLPDTSNDDSLKPELMPVGSPANSYVPDLSSPGESAEGVNLSPPKIVTRLSPSLIKPNLNIPDTADDKQQLGTLSPSNSSPFVGVLSVGANLQLGNSKKQ